MDVLDVGCHFRGATFLTRVVLSSLVPVAIAMISVAVYFIRSALATRAHRRARRGVEKAKKHPPDRVWQNNNPIFGAGMPGGVSRRVPGASSPLARANDIHVTIDGAGSRREGTEEAKRRNQLKIQHATFVLLL